MKHLFIPYRLALIAKQKGFPNHTGSCLAAWEQTKNAEWLHFGSHPVGLLQASLYQQIIDWFREKHSLIIEIQLDQTSTVKWAYDITKYNDFGNFERKVDVLNWGLYRNYYEALNKAIEEAFKLI